MKDFFKKNEWAAILLVVYAVFFVIPVFAIWTVIAVVTTSMAFTHGLAVFSVIWFWILAVALFAFFTDPLYNGDLD